jgi:hypothetical protein
MKSTALAVAFGILAITPATAYDGLKEDYATCTQGQGTVDNKLVVAACTRLINNAQVENETVGFFYALRASANTDRRSNCSDARKVLQLTKDPTFVSGAKTLIDANC